MLDFDSGDYYQKFSDYYTPIQIMGKGAFGVVVHAIDNYSGQQIAVKVIRKQNLKRQYLQRLRQQADILSALNHKNIIKFKHLKETGTRIFLVMEIIYGSNLRDFIRKNRLQRSQIVSIMKGILQAVQYMHSQNIIHRDIKPQNILIAKGQKFQVKMADFGLSSQFNWDTMESGKCGTLLYMAPQQQFNRFYSKSVDIWSCGIILYILLTNGEHPIANTHLDQSAYLQRLKNFQWKFSTQIPKEAQMLIKKMTQYIPLQRYSASQCLNHPFLKRTVKKVPLTAFEQFQKYSEDLKMKNMLYSLIFASILHPINQSTSPEPTINVIPAIKQSLSAQKPFLQKYSVSQLQKKRMENNQKMHKTHLASRKKILDSPTGKGRIYSPMPGKHSLKLQVRELASANSNFRSRRLLRP